MKTTDVSVLCGTRARAFVFVGLILLSSAVIPSPLSTTPVNAQPIVTDPHCIPVSFFLFALTLATVILVGTLDSKIKINDKPISDYTWAVALIGLALITCYRLLTGFSEGAGFAGFADFAGLFKLLEEEGANLFDLFCLLIGFGIVARRFEKSRLHEDVAKMLPDGWLGGCFLLLFVFGLSIFLDNIAAVLIGFVIANRRFDEDIPIGFLAAIVAAANGGGSGSPIGDTTTTMMWTAGVEFAQLAPAWIAAGAAFLVFGTVAAWRYQAPEQGSPTLPKPAPPTWGKMFGKLWKSPGVFVVLVVAVIANSVITWFDLEKSIMTWFDLKKPPGVPALGLVVLAAIYVTRDSRSHNHKQRHSRGTVLDSVQGAVFMLSLVLCAYMMPTESLPPASWCSTFALGFLSAFVDNVPLTALALIQGGYDWALLAYAVGFGGSMLWFGSSAGVALATYEPQIKNVGSWLKEGWYLIPAYVFGFAVLGVFRGWYPFLHG